MSVALEPRTKLSRMAELKSLQRERSLSSIEAEELANLLPPDYSIYGVGQGRGVDDGLTERESLGNCYHHEECSDGFSRAECQADFETEYER